jgi:quinol monooxygenase YgiN
LIEAFAERFGQHPDSVYTDTSFDTIIYFSEKWKNQAEYQERYQNIERMMTESKAK